MGISRAGEAYATEYGMQSGLRKTRRAGRNLIDFSQCRTIGELQGSLKGCAKGP